MKKILIIGASGFIGSALLESLKGYEIHQLKGRSIKSTNISELSSKVSGYDVIINLAGKSIFGIWTKKSKQEIYNSRVLTTRLIAQAVLETDFPPKHFINASAIGIYKPEVESDEFTNELGDGFLEKILKDWEKEASIFLTKNIKLTIIRIGIVLGKNGGAYKKLRQLTSLYLGTTFNRGQQSLSYISIIDLVRAVDFIIQKNLTGIVNLVSPEYSTYQELNRLLKKKLRVKISWNVPGIMIKLFFGESSTIFLSGHKIIPTVLLKNNFNFETPNLKTCVDKLESN